jgi:hypothetical protein
MTDMGGHALTLPRSFHGSVFLSSGSAGHRSALYERTAEDWTFVNAAMIKLRKTERMMNPLWGVG